MKLKVIDGLTAKETFELMVNDWIADQDNSKEIEWVSEPEYDEFTEHWFATLQDQDGEFFTVSDTEGENIIVV